MVGLTAKDAQKYRNYPDSNGSVHSLAVIFLTCYLLERRFVSKSPRIRVYSSLQLVGSLNP